jgi:hypothetical protein
MHAAGCSLEEIGDYVGHSSAYMTDRYRHLMPGSHRQAAARLDALIDAHAARGGPVRSRGVEVESVELIYEPNILERQTAPLSN